MIQKFISDVGVGENGFSIMVSDEGQLVYSPRDSGDLRMINGLSTDIRESGNAGLVDLINEALRKESGNGLGKPRSTEKPISRHMRPCRPSGGLW